MFDPYSPDFVEDPYPTYSRLRAETPVFRDDEWGLTFFTRHADVIGILRDRRFGRDVRESVPRDRIDRDVFERIYPSHLPLWTSYIRDSFIDLEPPAHTRIRRLVQWAFSRRASENYRHRLEETAAEALDQAVERGQMEAIADFATPIPLTMISELLGVPSDVQPTLVEWSHRIVRVFDANCSVEEGELAEQATRDFVEYCRELISDHRRSPKEDLITALLEAEVDGDRLSEHELVATCILVLNAGHEATVQAIGNGLLSLVGHPDEYRRLRQDPELGATAVEELLRHDTPLQMFERWVLEDIDWNDVFLPQGSKVGLLFGSANHDEDVFRDPSRVDLGRSPNPHVAFGAGVHHCVGASLARVELDVALRSFVSRVAEFAPMIEQPERTPSLVFRGVRELPLSLVPA